MYASPGGWRYAIERGRDPVLQRQESKSIKKTLGRCDPLVKQVLKRKKTFFCSLPADQLPSGRGGPAARYSEKKLINIYRFRFNKTRGLAGVKVKFFNTGKPRGPVTSNTSLSGFLNGAYRSRTAASPTTCCWAETAEAFLVSN